jgi:hypothetical protein
MNRRRSTAVHDSIRRGDSKAAFAAVRSYQDLIDANFAFLSGKLDSTPYHGGPVGTETVPLLGNLRKINQSGFVTIEGQPALCEYNELAMNGRKRYDQEQKSHLGGFLPIQQAVDFVGFMKKRPMYITVWNTSTNKVMFSNQPSARYAVTRSRYAGTAAYDDNTVSHVQDHDYVDENFYLPNIIEVLRGKTVYVNLVGKNWCSGNVEDHVMEYFRSRAPNRNRRRSSSPNRNRRRSSSPNRNRRRSPNRRSRNTR